MALLLITRFTLQEAIRRRLFLAVIILSALLLVAFIILLSVPINLFQSNSSANGGTLSPQLFLLSGGVFFDILMIWLAYVLSSFLTIALTTVMISGEVEAGTFAGVD